MTISRFTHDLKLANPRTDDELKAFMLQNTVKRRTGVAMLRELTVEFIKEEDGYENVARLLTVIVDIMKNIGNDKAKRLYTVLRKAVASKHGINSRSHQRAIAVLTLPKEYYDEKRVEYQTKVRDRNIQPRVIPSEFVRELVEQTIVATDTPSKVIIAQLSIGSRISEILRISGYAIEGQAIKQSHISKSVDPDMTITKGSLFLSAHQLIAKIISVREDIKGIAEVSATMTQRVNAKLATLTGAWPGGKVTSHDLRRIYVAIKYDQIVASGSFQSQASIYQHLLGHAELDHTTCNSYMGLRVQNSERLLVILNKQPIAVPRNTGQRDGRVYERLVETANAIQHNGDKLTTKLLMSYGYGRDVVRRYWREHPRE